MTTQASRFITLTLLLASLVLMAGCSHGGENGESPYVTTPDEVPHEGPIQLERDEDATGPVQDHDGPPTGAPT